MKNISYYDLRIRANWAISVPPEVEERIHQAILKFDTQSQIIDGIMRARQGRKLPGKAGHYLELFIRMEACPSFDYAPYRNLVAAIDEQTASSPKTQKP